MSNTIQGGIGHWWGLKLRQFVGLTYYVDYTLGSDASADPTNINTPWKTLTKARTGPYSFGDSVLFKRGESWMGRFTPPSSGTPSSPIVFGSYGEGALPIISGVETVANSATAGSWTDYTATVAGVWYITLAHIPRRIMLGGTEYFCPLTVPEIDATYRWCWVDADDRLYVYSPAGNPATVGLTVQESGANYTPLRIEPGTHDVKVKDFDFQGGNYSVVFQSVTNPIYNIEIANCNIGKWAMNGLTIWKYTGATADLVQSHDISVHDCAIASHAPQIPLLDRDYSEEGWIAEGIYLRSCDDVSIYNNAFSGWMHTGLYLWSAADTAERTGGLVRRSDIHHNTFVRALPSCKPYGISSMFEGHCSYNDFHHNAITDVVNGCQIDGTYNKFRFNLIDGVTEQGYYQDSAGGKGVGISSAYSPAHHNEVTDNIIKNTQYSAIAVIAKAGEDYVPENTLIARNIAINCGGDTSYGDDDASPIRIDTLAGPVTVTDNHVPGDAIWYRGAVHTVAEFNAHNGDNSDVITGNDLEVD